MKEPWPVVSLGKVITQRKEFIQIDDLATYKRCRVQLHAQGIVLRDAILGAEIKTKKQQVCHAGEFLVAEIDAKVGGFGIVPEGLDGAIVSSHYFLFVLDGISIDQQFLDYFIRTRWFRDQITAQGSTNYAAIRPEDVLSYQMPLPPLDEQRRIVARIEELAARIEEARELRRQISDSGLHNLRIASFYRAFQGKVIAQNANDEPASVAIEKMAALKLQIVKGKKIRAEKPLPPISEIEKQHQLPKSWEWVRLGDLCELITDGTHQTPRYADEGMIFLSAQNVKPYRFMPQNHRYVSFEDYLSYIHHAKPEMGDILMTRVGAMIGEAAIIDQELDFAFYVSLCLIRPLKDYVHVPYILHWLNSPYGAASSRKNTLGKGHSQGNLNLNLIERFVLPLPPLNEQRRIVSYLDSLQSKLDALRRCQSETAAALDALLPAVLERAFRGEL